MTAIIILNWNGADDTIACLHSLSQAKGDFSVFVIDNGSTDDSVARIGTYMLSLEESTPHSMELVPMDDNYGFAKGNNRGIAYVRSKYTPDSFLLLNNDTEVTPDFLEVLTTTSLQHPEYRVLTPKINYFYDKHKVWNCGGHLFFGLRKYYYAGASDDTIQRQEILPVSFVTGCALFFYPEVLDTEGKLFTERFFFGEEDFEFSLRMQKQGLRMACLYDSLIYHKVGASGDKMNSFGKLYMHYLNRFIDIRTYFPSCKYQLWKWMNIPLVLRYFYQRTHSVGKSWHYVRRLCKDAAHKNGVTHDDFNRLVLFNTYFD